MEGGAEVGDEGGVEGAVEEFLDDGQEVVEGSSQGERWGTRGSGNSASGSQEEGVLDERERHAASL